MSENDKFIFKKEISSLQKFNIDNTKLIRNEMTFSTNYLNTQDQIILILQKNFISLLRDSKSLIAIFVSPVIFLLILIFLQYLSENFTQGNVIKEQIIEKIDNISLKCHYPSDCLSLGIAIIVKNK